VGTNRSLHSKCPNAVHRQVVAVACILSTEVADYYVGYLKEL